MLIRNAFFTTLLLALQAAAAPIPIEIFKTPTCGCCSKWVAHLKENGFAPTVTDVPSTAEFRKKYGVPDKLMSCHTGVVAGYAVEGHVPAADILRLLKQKPKAKGLAVPGMPMGSPGMEQGGRRDAYSVLVLDDKGEAKEFQKYPGQ